VGQPQDTHSRLQSNGSTAPAKQAVSDASADRRDVPPLANTAAEEAMATCEDTVLHYMQTQNRPFSVTNIVDALQSSGFKKPTITRALESLAANGQLISVNEGKVYLAAQSDAAAVGDEVRGTLFGHRQERLAARLTPFFAVCAGG
jgi:predicted MarR family transcription regulator